MYFNILSDTGTEIHGYLIPDGFSAKPALIVNADGRVYGPIPCDVFLEGPKRNHDHETGVVGFQLTSAQIPGLRPETNVEIADADTGFTFYRRFIPGQHLKKRVFRLETQFVPHSELDVSLKPFFQFHAGSVDQYGSETIRQSLEIINQSSTYVSGRVLLKNIQQYLTPDTIKITSLRDPFYELAVRLTVITHFRKQSFSYLSQRDEIIFAPAMEYFHDLDLNDEVALATKIKNAPRDIIDLFESPFTKQLVAASPSDSVSREQIASALDVLSQFTLFDPSETGPAFAHDIGELLGIDQKRIRFLPLSKTFIDIAEKLRSIKILEHVLENDLILHYFIRRAERKSEYVKLPFEADEADMHIYRLIDESGLFDHVFYMRQFENAPKDKFEAIAHYVEHGAALELDPSAMFSSRGYMKYNPDVAAAKINPLLHYVVSGKDESRRSLTVEEFSKERPLVEDGD